MQQQREQLSEFIRLLTGSDSNPVQFQVYHDSDKSDGGKNLACTFYNDVPGSVDFLNQQQKLGCGVYITVNETDGTGRKSSNIISLRACFIDGDNQPLPSSWACEPDLIVSRNALHWHAYWLLDYTTDFDTWAKLQYQIALYYGVKDRLFDTPRVMRAPGFIHLKNPNAPEEYKLIWHRAESNRYKLTDLITGHALNPVQLQEYNNWLTIPKIKKSANAIDVIDDSEANINAFAKRLSSITPETGDYNNTLFRAAAIGKDNGLSEDKVIEQIMRWWSNSWSIPVEPKSIRKITNNAYRYSVNAIGSATTAGVFANAPPLEFQIGNEKDMRTVVEGIETADIKYAKNHTLNARIFLQVSSDKNIHYVTVRELTYAYEGTRWRKLEPKELKKHVLNAMLMSKPTLDVVSGTASIVSLLTANDSLASPPCWIADNGTGADAKDIIAFKNGLLDIANNKWYEHTPELFYTNCCEYSYDPNATNHRWLDYLRNEVFDDNDVIIKLVQEWMGYMLMHNYDYQKIMLFLGAPRSGKGTIASVIRHIAGEHNCCGPTLTGLLKDPTLEYMQDKPIAIIGDAHKVAFAKRDEVLEMLKMISGCDPLTFTRKYISSANTVLPSRFTLCANKMPEFLDSSGALAGRLLIVPFRNSYLNREDPKRLEKLLQEAPGILNWALEGLRRLRSNQKFTVCKESEEMLSVLREDLSPISAFMVDCIEVTDDEDDYVIEREMYDMYRIWCACNDHRAMASKVFKVDFRSANYKIRQRKRAVEKSLNKERVFTNVKITNRLDSVVPGGFVPAIALRD